MLLVVVLVAGLLGGSSCDGEATVRLQQSIVPEPVAATVDEVVAPVGNWTTMVEALDVFNARNLANNWERREEGAVGTECERHVARYIEGLRRQELWAMKSEWLFFFLVLWGVGERLD